MYSGHTATTEKKYAHTLTWHTTHTYVPYVRYLITRCVDLILIQLRHHVVFHGNNKTVADVQQSIFSAKYTMKKIKKKRKETSI